MFFRGFLLAFPHLAKNNGLARCPAHLGSLCLPDDRAMRLCLSSHPWPERAATRDNRAGGRHHLAGTPMMDYISRVCPAASHYRSRYDFAPCLQSFFAPFGDCDDLAPPDCISYRSYPVLIAYHPRSAIRSLDFCQHFLPDCLFHQANIQSPALHILHRAQKQFRDNAFLPALP